MRRREFISLIGGAAAAWPLSASAQRTGKVSRIGYLGASSASLERRDLDAFRQTLRDLGHVEGDNTTIEYRWAEGDVGKRLITSSISVNTSFLTVACSLSCRVFVCKKRPQACLGQPRTGTQHRSQQ